MVALSTPQCCDIVPGMVQHQTHLHWADEITHWINMLVSNPQLTNCVNTGGLHYLIVSLWQVPLFPETHLQKEAKLTSKKLGKLRLAPKTPMPWMSSSPSSSHPAPPWAQPMLRSSLPPPLMGQLLFSDGDKEMADTTNPSYSSLSSALLAPSTDISSSPILLPPQPTTSSSSLPVSSLPPSSLSSNTILPLLMPPLLPY